MAIKKEDKLNNIESKLENALKRGLILAGQLVSQRARGHAPIKTGRLKRSITRSRGGPEKVGPLHFQMRVGTNVEYAAIQEFGSKTKPHVIKPKTKKALAFEWPNAPAGLKPSKTGKYVFLSVNHPGSVVPAHPYLRPAINESKDEIRALIIKNVTAALGGK